VTRIFCIVFTKIHFSTSAKKIPALFLDRKAEFDMQKIFRIVPVNNIRYHII